MTTRRISSFIVAVALIVGGVLLYQHVSDPGFVQGTTETVFWTGLGIALGLFGAGAYWLWFGFILPGLNRSLVGRVVVIAISIIVTVFPVAITALYVLGETYGQWVTG